MVYLSKFCIYGLPWTYIFGIITDGLGLIGQMSHSLSLFPPGPSLRYLNCCWQCRATGAAAQVKLAPPRQDELGFAESLSCKDIGGSSVIVLEQPPATGQICSIVLKGSTEQLLDDLERAVDDGVNTFKVRLLCLRFLSFSSNPSAPGRAHRRHSK